MALRFLIYINRLYEKMIAENDLNVYRRNLIKIPRPEFICLYNGIDDFPEEKILRLSDSFEQIEKNDRIDLELVVQVLNISKENNKDKVQESKTLSGYVFFTDRIKSNVENRLLLEKAIDEAVKYCLATGILMEFLSKYPLEVASMLATEFDMEKALHAVKLDGIEQGKADIVMTLLAENFTDDRIINITKISQNKLNKLKELYSAEK